AEADDLAEESKFAAAESEAERRLEGEREGGGRRRRRGRGERGEAAREGAQQFTHDTVPEHVVAHEDHEAGPPAADGRGSQQARKDRVFGERGPRQGRRRRRARRTRG